MDATATQAAPADASPADRPLTAAAALAPGSGAAIAQAASTAVHKYIGNVSQALQAKSNVSVNA